MVIVAAAGPAINIGLAYLSALLLHLVPMLPPDAAVWVSANLINLIKINVILAVFNMLPLPLMEQMRDQRLEPDVTSYLRS